MINRVLVDVKHAVNLVIGRFEPLTPKAMKITNLPQL